MNKLLFITLAIVISSCRQRDTNSKIVLPNGIDISLLDGEVQNRKPPAFLMDDYFSTFNANNDHQIPLYRTVEHKDYIFYIGLPYNFDLDKIFKDNLIEENYNLVKAKRKDHSIYKVYQKNNKYAVEFVKQLEKNLIYILAITDSEESLKNALSLPEFLNRIKENSK